MATNVLLLHYNNYFNRIVKRLETIDAYKAADPNYSICNTVNFVPGDGVTTSLVLGYGNNPSNLFDNGANFDYLVVMDSESPAYTIQSRWFIMEGHRTRDGQYELMLKRDVIADELETLYDAPVFVEKGMLQDTDLMVTNDEGMSLNQIKTSETLLKDNTNSAWIVGYLAKNAVAEDINIPIPGKKIIEAVSLSEIAQELGISENSLQSMLNIESTDNKTIDCLNQINTAFWIGEQAPITVPDLVLRPRFNSNDLSWIDTIEGNANRNQGFVSTRIYTYSYGQYRPIYNNYNLFINPLKQKIAQLASGIKTEVKNIIGLPEYFDMNDFNVFNKYADKAVNYLGVYYRFKVELVNSSLRRVNNINLNSYENFNTAFKYAITQSGGPSSPSYNNPAISLETYSKRIKVTLEELPEDTTGEGSIATKITSSRTKTIGQEFDAFAIPYNAVTVNDGTQDINLTGEYAQRVAAVLARQFDSELYDVQLLPYCPFPEKVIDNKIDMSDMTENVDFNWINMTPPSTGEASFRKVSNFMLTPTETEGVWSGLFIYITSVPNNGTIANLSASVIDPNNTGMLYDVSATVSSGVITGKKFITISYHSSVGETATLEENGIEILVSYDYQMPSMPTKKIGAIYYLEGVSFETQLNYPLNLYKNMKFDSNCTLYRLVSPNYQGTFDFNVARNGGSVSGFTAACTYKPYTPFIKVAPVFAGLYGGNFGDSRGLICGGDYSLPRTNSAWESYQLQNKNYQNIFNREIQNLEFMQSIETRNAVVGGLVGMVTGGATSGGAGALIGGAAGGVAGALMGAGTSAVGLGIDLDTLARTQQEQKQLAIDKFNYQLGNIKALPYTLTKVGAFDISSKIFPFLEFYICSQEEAAAFENKIDYESMTVMRIGTLREFMNFDGTKHYFKGRLIRNTELKEDAHKLNVIYNELDKGVYI